MQFVKGFKIELPEDDGILERIMSQMDFQLGELHHFVEKSGRSWLLVGQKTVTAIDYQDLAYGFTGLRDIIPQIPSSLQMICQERKIPISPYGTHYLIESAEPKNPNWFLYPSRITITNTLEKFPAPSDLVSEFGTIQTIDLTSEEERRETRILHVKIGLNKSCTHRITYSHRLPFPQTRTLLTLQEHLPLNLPRNYITIWFHPHAVVNFSGLNSDKQNPLSYWHYLPQDIITHYIYPMITQVAKT